MEVNALISTVILVSFIVTIILAVGSYMMYKARERRRPRAQVVLEGSDPVYFERFLVARPAESAAQDADRAGSAPNA
jgi:heme/copper-type cytochrome/quinol oxidase subunit 2